MKNLKETQKELMTTNEGFVNFLLHERFALPCSDPVDSPASDIIKQNHETIGYNASFLGFMTSETRCFSRIDLGPRVVTDFSIKREAKSAESKAKIMSTDLVSESGDPEKSLAKKWERDMLNAFSDLSHIKHSNPISFIQKKSVTKNKKPKRQGLRLEDLLEVKLAPALAIFAIVTLVFVNLFALEASQKMPNVIVGPVKQETRVIPEEKLAEYIRQNSHKFKGDVAGIKVYGITPEEIVGEYEEPEVVKKQSLTEGFIDNLIKLITE